MWKTTLAIVSTAMMPLPALAGEWTDLFNGRNLDGWQRLGGDHEFDVKRGQIVGKAVLGEPNGWVMTEERYDDFILEASFKVSGRLNSGLFFRSDSTPEFQNGRVFGYQMEVDPSDRNWAGGIHEEAKRGWLYPVTRNDACQDAFRKDDWNEYRVEAIGYSIRTFVNGVPCARLVDKNLSEGYIGLQVHSVSEDGRMGFPDDTITWRKVRIMTEDLQDARTPMPDDVPEISYLTNELTDWERDNGFKLLFDGKTTKGWRGARLDGFPARGWKVEDGMLIVESSGGAESRNGGDIITLEEYSDFEVEVDFRISEGANSGIKYFVDPDLLQGEGSAIGLEFQILDDEKHPDAKQGVAGNRTVGSLYDLITAVNHSEPNRAKRFNGVGKWNRARIVSKGDKVEHWLNNVKVVEFTRGSQMYRALVAYSKYAKWDNFGEWEKGPILLQDHGDEVHFKNIKIRDLSE